MPTYVYVCGNGHEEQVFHPMSGAGPESCTECGADVKKKIQAGLRPIFKGGGFYETDYKSPPKPPEVNSD